MSGAPDLVRELTLGQISEMEERRDDPEYQLALCVSMIRDDEILPYPFERAVILLRRAKRYRDEVEICRYVERWCRDAERRYTGDGAMHWMSPRLQRIIKRHRRAEQLAGLGNRLNQPAK